MPVTPHFITMPMPRFTPSRVQFVLLLNEDDIRRTGLDEFAASFNHRVPRLFPIWVGVSDGKILAFSHVHSRAVSYPAVHPSISPRGFYDLSHAWVHHLTLHHGDPLILVPDFWSDDLMAKVGLEPADQTLYKIMEKPIDP